MMRTNDEARLRAAFEKDRQRAQQLRRNARAPFRILLEGIRAQISVAELCRREGIHSTVYYTWLIDLKRGN